MARRTKMMATTTMSSSSVKPEFARRGTRLSAAIEGRLDDVKELVMNFRTPISARISPRRIPRAVEGRAVRKRVNVEDIFAAPTRRFRVVLNRTHAPLGASAHGIDRNAAEKAHAAFSIRAR